MLYLIYDPPLDEQGLLHCPVTGAMLLKTSRHFIMISKQTNLSDVISIMITVLQLVTISVSPYSYIVHAALSNSHDENNYVVTSPSALAFLPNHLVDCEQVWWLELAHFSHWICVKLTLFSILCWV